MRLAAVQNGQVFPFDDNLVSRPGPRLVDGLEALAKLLHPGVHREMTADDHLPLLPILLIMLILTFACFSAAGGPVHRSRCSFHPLADLWRVLTGSRRRQ